MGDGDDRARIVLQKPLEPGDRLRVEMVRRLVEEQQVRRLEQEPAERDPPPLAARQRRDIGVRRRQPQRVHGELEPRVEVPGIGGVDLVLDARLLVQDLLHFVGRQIFAELRIDVVVARQQGLDLGDALLDVAEHVLRRVQTAAPDAETRPRGPSAGNASPRNVVILARHDAQQRALAGAVQPQHADLRAGQKRQPDVFENLDVGRMNLPETFHGVNELRHRFDR